MKWLSIALFCILTAKYSYQVQYNLIVNCQVFSDQIEKKKLSLLER